MLLPEWSKQGAILLAWPTESTDWHNPEDPSTLRAVQATYIQLMNTLLPFQNVVLLVQPNYYKKSIKHIHELLHIAFNKIDSDKLTAYLKRLKTYPIDYNDTWLRDSGPLSFQNKDRLTWLNFNFNGWGEKHAFEKDTRITAQLHANQPFCEQADLIQIDWVLEGGSVESNGHGLLLTTRACLLNSNRAKHRSTESVERHLQQHLGARQILWLHHGHIVGDDTDSHIDTLARFCNPTTIAYQSCDEAAYPGFESLKKMHAELTAFAARYKLTLVALPWPKACFDNKNHANRLPATYANFLITNQNVIVPQYQVPEDQQAIATFKKIYRNRNIVGLNCTPLIQQGGSLHCITMQLPGLKL